MENKKFVESLFSNILSLKTRDVRLGHGSFITMGFGKDISYEIVIRREKQTKFRPEWFLWVYMCSWELKQNENIIISDDDERDNIEESIQLIEDKKILNVKMINDNYDLLLEFEDGFSLRLFANLEDDNEQWMFFTPNKQVFSAGPATNYTYEKED